MFKSFMAHIPVLLNEVLKYLDPKPEQNFIDCTIGGGGHAFAILEKTAPGGKLLGIDLWEEAIRELSLKSQILNTKNRLILVNDSFVKLKEIVEKYNFSPVQGILLDLGLSSDLLEKSGRGFSFKKNEILDMRLNLKQSLTAKEILNKWKKEDLIKIFQEFGQERFSKKIVREIIEFRQRKEIKTSFELVDLIKKVIKQKFLVKSLARIFQSLRIAVNNELENLKNVLPQAVEILRPQGRLAVISYHSLEDRIVKHFLKTNPLVKVLTPSPISPSQKERKENPRSRSAKLRVAEKYVSLYA